jgi:hypothetical protein
MRPQQMEPGSGDEHTEFRDELQRIEYQMRRAVAAGVRQHVQELPAGALRQPVQTLPGPQSIPARGGWSGHFICHSERTHHVSSTRVLGRP